MASGTTEQAGAAHSSLVAQHYNQLQESGLEQRTQSRIFYMRNFNNWIKSMAIGDALGQLRKEKGNSASVSVLDLCAGKGGDLLKWRKGKIDRLICADIAGTSMEQCEARYTEMRDRAAKERFPQKVFHAEEFITADCTKVRLKDEYKSSATTLFDLVSCQFSFHYSFESHEQAEMMVRNACECLKPGGYFIGTTPNALELVKRLRASENGSFGNEVYRVTFDPSYKEKELPLFGAKYDFHLEGVVDCPEFLVYFPAFEKLAAKYNMRLVFKKTFAEYFEEMVNQGEGRALIGRMQALEPFPPEEDIELLAKSQDAYKTAKERVQQLTSQQEHAEGEEGRRRKAVKVGTLSQDEWEATSIYLVFAFQKMEARDSSPAPEAPVPSETSQEGARKRGHEGLSEGGKEEQEEHESQKLQKTS